MKNGKIGVTTENIFPVIKKFLYSDHEIFLRELISNAVDATQKLKTLSSIGEMKGELGDLTIHVAVDKEAKTLTVTDRGVGMTAEEVDKYINQIAFSGAEEFMEKYKNQSIIGHFGLGFYSSFMVADKVEIFTKSYKKEAKTVHWSCTGTPEFEMEETDAEHDRGTTIVLHLSEDSLEYAESSKVEELLRKYCRFLPVPIAFGKVKEWKDGKYVDTDKDNIINNIDPLWTRKPADITEEQYKEFRRLRRENAELLRGQQMHQQEAQIRAQSEKWYMEAEAMRGNPMYQNFDLVQELQNDEFVNLLKAGTPMEHAYKVLHFDELMGNAVQAAAASTEKKVADNVRAKGNRPSENGTSSNSAFVTKTDPSKLTRADFEEIERRVARGERISF